MSWVSTRRLQYFYNKIKENYYNETEVDTKVDGLNSSISSEATARQNADAQKVDKVTTASRVYGTDENGDQTTYDFNALFTA